MADLVVPLRVRELGREVVRMSTRCQIAFSSGHESRTVYRHWDGYPSAVILDLLAFLAWSTRGGDVEYEVANFLSWSKRALDEQAVQLGFGVCDGRLHGDVEYYYLVAHDAAGTTITAYVVEQEGGPQLGRVVQEVAVPQPLSFSAVSSQSMELPRVRIKGVWYYRDERLQEYRRVDNPHERIAFEEAA